MKKCVFFFFITFCFFHVILPAQTNFVVNSISDGADANPGDGICDDGAGNCTFRAAIEEANSTSATDTITFDFVAFNPILLPDSALPDITATVIIDGTSEPNYNGTPEIEFRGDSAGFASGLVITNTANGSAIKGLSIVGFMADPATPFSTGYGIEIYGDSNSISANYIGLRTNGTTGLANERSGILINGGAHNEIGGNGVASRNLISSNSYHGILLRNGANNNAITGNYIGLNEFGSTSGNGHAGIKINWGHDNTIGNLQSGGKNRIAHNGTSGIMIKDTSGNTATNNRIDRDSIYNNTRPGIDLQGDGITMNDPGDADAGANNLQNYPLLSNIQISGGNVDLTYEVPTDPANASYPIEVKFFKQDNHRQGQAFLGADSYTAADFNNGPEKSISFTSVVSISSFNNIIAIATDNNGNTSEYGFTRPNPPSATDSFRCGPGDVTLFASGNLRPGEDFFWYQDSTSSNPIDSGNSFLTPYLTDTTTYWVAIRDSFGIASHKTTAHAFIGDIPNVMLDSFEDVCIDSDPVELTSGTPAGGDYSGTAVFGETFYPSSAGIGTHIITYSYTAPNGCDSSVSRPITVHAVPSVTLGDPGEYCVDATDKVLSFGAPAGGIYSGTGMINDSVFSPSTAGVGNHSITYTYTDSNGCNASGSRNIRVHSLPSVFLSTFNDICLNDNFIFLNNGSPGGGVYSGPGVVNNRFYPDSAGVGTHTISYTYTNSNGCDSTVSQPITVHDLPEVTFDPFDEICRYDTVIALNQGLPAGGTYQGDGVQGNSFYPQQVQSGQNDITYTYTDSNGCAVSVTDTFQVLPLPNVNLGFLQDICINDSFRVLTSGTPAGGFYSGPGMVSDTFYPAPAGTGTHEITYTYADSNGCVASDNSTIRVNDIPNVTLDLPDSVCLSTSNFRLNGGNPPGGDYFGNGVTSGRFYPDQAGVGDHEIVYSYTNFRGCTSEASDTITVLPLPNVNAGLDITACQGAEVELNGSGSGSFQWSPATGLSDPTVANPTLTAIFTRMYTLTVTDANGCTNEDEVRVSVVNQITADAGPDTFVCSGQSIQLLATGGSEYTWEPAYGLTDSSIANPWASPDSATTYIVKVASGSCQDADTVTVTTRNTTAAGYNQSLDLCIDAAPVALSGGNPTGGSYFGAGVSNDTFYASQSGSGQFDVGYVFENQQGCRDTAYGSVSVKSQLGLTYEADSVCINNDPVVLHVGTPSGGSYAGPGVTKDSIFNPSTAGLGTHQITYTYNATQACMGTDTLLLTVNPAPIVNVGSGATYCNNDGPDTLTVGNPAGGIYSGPGVNNNIFYPDSLTPGKHTITYTYTNQFGCSNSANFEVSINPAPITGIPADTSICNGESIRFFAQEGATFNWTPGTGLNDSTGKAPIATPQTTTTYTLLSTNNLGCKSIDTSRIEVYENPVATATGDTTICQEHCVRLGGAPTATNGNPPYNYEWTPTDSLDDPTSADPRACLIQSETYYLHVSDANGCEDRDTVNINVLNHPPVEYSLSVDSFTITLEDTTELAVSRNWDFGDGNSDTAASTSHTFGFEGLFRVCLEVTFTNGCVETACKLVTIATTGIDDPFKDRFTVYPNPTDGKVVLDYDGISSNATLSLYRIDGKQIFHEQLNQRSGKKILDIRHQPQGLYLLKIEDGKNATTFRIMRM